MVVYDMYKFTRHFVAKDEKSLTILAEYSKQGDVGQKVSMNDD